MNEWSSKKQGLVCSFLPHSSGFWLTFSSFSHTLYSCRSSSQTMSIQDILRHHIVFLSLSRTLGCSRSRSSSERSLTSWSSCGNNIWSRGKHIQQWKQQRRMKSTASGSSQRLARNMYQQLLHRWLQL